LQFDSLPIYSVKELNEAIGKLINRGFAPRFLIKATVSECQLKKGHLWMTLSDGNASVNAVIWSSQLSQVQYRPNQQDGVLVLGKLNFWETQARINVNVIDVKPSISTVLRKFEVVRKVLNQDGLLDQSRKKSLPIFPEAIAILTSVPSSALADILRTAKERWPLTKLFIISIPVQGDVARKVLFTLKKLSDTYQQLGVDALILARGGGSREDLILFDDEELCRQVADFPIPVITGIGHEDDLTVIDLVSDHRSATPTAAIVDLLPSRQIAIVESIQKQRMLSDYFTWFLKNQTSKISDKLNLLKRNSPKTFFEKCSSELNLKIKILNAFSPNKILKRGFCIVKDSSGKLIKTINNISSNQLISIEFVDGTVDSKVKIIYNKNQN
tara:strand:- start:17433 stop:18587 length:1155 start_codon:yes stop_codon:yes gene_type:complete